MAVKKDYFSTKTNRNKFRQGLFAFTITIDDDDYIIRKGNKFIAYDDCFYIENYLNDKTDDLILNDEKSIITVNKDLEDILVNKISDKDGMEKFLTEYDDSSIQSSHVSLIEEKLKVFNNLLQYEDDYFFKISLNEDIINEIDGIMEENANEFYVYPSLKFIDNKAYIDFQTARCEAKTNLYIENKDNIRELDIFFPFEIVRKIKKIEKCDYYLYRSKTNPDKVNIAIIDVIYSGFRYKFYAQTMKEKTK